MAAYGLACSTAAYGGLRRRLRGLGVSLTIYNISGSMWPRPVRFHMIKIFTVSLVPSVSTTVLKIGPTYAKNDWIQIFLHLLEVVLLFVLRHSETGCAPTDGNNERISARNRNKKTVLSQA